jgi:hypothetical protein
MINLFIRIIKGYMNCISIDAIRSGNPNTNVELLQKFVNVLAKKVHFDKITAETKIITRYEVIDENRYDNIFSLFSLMPDAEPIKVTDDIFYQKNKITHKRKIKMFRYKKIPAELIDFFIHLSRLNFNSWNTKNDNMYYFKFKNEKQYMLFLKKLRDLDITDFNINELISSNN